MKFEVGNVVRRHSSSPYENASMQVGDIGMVTRCEVESRVLVKILIGQLKDMVTWPRSEHMIVIADSLDKLPLLYRLIL